MGIKFYCPNGHKVNVKSFLAGKKGLCPKCGVRVDIPLESVKRDRSKAALGTAGDTTEADDTNDEEEQEIAMLPSASEPVSQPSSTPTFGLEMGRPTSVPTHSISPASVSNGSQVASSVAPPQQFGDFGNELPPATKAAPVSNDILSPAASQPPYLPAPAQPNWHVQLATGQQFGPIEETTLQQWIAENRISPNDLLWREGWPQWQSAVTVFPQWHHGQRAAALPTAVAVATQPLDDPLGDAVRSTAVAAGTPATWLRQRHRGKREIRATLSLVLLGLVVLLFALLLYIFFIREQPDSKQSCLPNKQMFVSIRGGGGASTVNPCAAAINFS